MKSRSLLLPVIVACLLPPALAAQPESNYSFSLNGTPIQPQVLSLNGRPEKPAEGDVIVVGGFHLALGPPDAYRFVADHPNRGRLYRAGSNSVRRVVAARRKKKVNGLAGLAAAELRGLRGLESDCWDEQTRLAITAVDVERTCLVLADSDTVRAEHRVLSVLPPETRYLISPILDDFHDYSRLGRLDALRLFIAGGWRIRIEDLLRCRQLRFLELTWTNVESFAPLAALQELRNLRLAHAVEGHKLGFLRSLPNLVRLELQAGLVDDLTPILACPRLEWIDVSGTRAEKLPVCVLPRLRVFRLFGCDVPKEQVERFQRCNPGCHLVVSTQQAIREALAGTTLLRVRTRGFLRVRVSRNGTPLSRKRVVQTLEEDDPAVIANLVANLELDPDPGMHGVWGSGADAWFEWSREGAPKVRFGLLSGVGAVRWHADGWGSDAQLTEKGHAFLLDWLAERGVDQPKRVLEFGRRRRQTND